jgi:hypothetical protein
MGDPLRRAANPSVETHVTVFSRPVGVYDGRALAERNESIKVGNTPMRKGNLARTMSVNEVKDGGSTIEYSYQDLEATSQGKTATMPADSMPMGLGGGLDPSSFANQTGLAFPDAGSVKPGDEWTGGRTLAEVELGRRPPASTWIWRP